MDEHPNPGTLFERIEWVRWEKLGLKPHGLSVRLKEATGREEGFSSSTVHRYHADEREPPVSYLEALADLAGVDAGWILTGEGSPNGPAPGPDYADGIRWALTHIEATAESLRRRLEEVDPGAAADAGRQMPPEELQLLGRLHGLVEDEAVQEAHPGAALQAAIALINRHFELTKAQASMWRLLLETLEAGGIYSREDEVEWTEEDLAKVDPSLISPPAPTERGAKAS